METSVEIEFLDIRKNQKYIELINNVVNTCFIEENLQNSNMYLNIILTNPKNIKSINKQYRNIDKETDVLSFPMFEKEELEKLISLNEWEYNDILGNLIYEFDENLHLNFQQEAKVKSKFTIKYLRKTGFKWHKLSNQYLNKFINLVRR